MSAEDRWLPVPNDEYTKFALGSEQRHVRTFLLTVTIGDDADLMSCG